MQRVQVGAVMRDGGRCGLRVCVPAVLAGQQAASPPCPCLAGAEAGLGDS